MNESGAILDVSNLLDASSFSILIIILKLC